MADSRKNFKWCFVPSCNNNSQNSPSKIFLNVPLGAKRQIWCEAVGAQHVSSSSHLCCCEDHFNVHQDVVNYEWYEYTRSLGLRARMKLKEEVIPRLSSASHDVESQGSQRTDNILNETKEDEEAFQKVQEDGNKEEEQASMEADENEEELGVIFISADDSVENEEAIDCKETHIENLSKDFSCQVKLCCSKSPALAFSKICTINCIPSDNIQPLTNKSKRPKFEEAAINLSTGSSDSFVKVMEAPVVNEHLENKFPRSYGKLGT